MIPLLRRSPLKRRPLTFRRRKRRARARAAAGAAAASRPSQPLVMFEQSRGELPVATLHGAPGSLLAQTMGGLGRWVATRLAWLRPRAVPVAVALIGMFAVLNAVNYLAKPPAAHMAAGVSASASMIEQPAYSFHIKLVLQQ